MYAESKYKFFTLLIPVIKVQYHCINDNNKYTCRSPVNS